MKVAIVGAGWVAADRHLPAYRRLSGVDIVAICDSKLSASEKLANGLPGDVKATTSLEELVAERPNLVSVCTPPHVRHAITLKLIEHGISVFLEKPMAMNLLEATEIANAAEKQGVLVCVSHNFLFSRAMRQFRRWESQGKTGAITQVLGLQFSSPRRRLPNWYGELPGGLLFDESPHLLYVIRDLLGDVRVVSVEATLNAATSRQPVGVLNATLAGGSAPATISMNFNSPVSEWHVAIVCAKSIVILDLFRDVAIRIASDGPHKGRDILQTSIAAGFGHYFGVVASGARVALGRQDWGHGELIRQVVEAVRTGSVSPVKLSESLKVVQILDELVDSIQAT